MKFRKNAPQGEIAKALAKRYHLTPAQAERAAGMLRGKLAEAVTEGRTPGFFEFLPDGSVDISMLDMTKIIEEATKP